MKIFKSEDLPVSGTMQSHHTLCNATGDWRGAKKFRFAKRFLRACFSFPE